VYKDKFKRIERAMLSSRLAHHRICVLQPSASMRNQYPYDASVREILAWHELLFPRNYLYEIVPEEYFRDGRARLADFDVLILPYAVYLPRKLETEIETWMGRGKRLLLSSGPFGLRDEIARGSGGLWRKVFPKAQVSFAQPHERSWSWPDGHSSAAFLRGRSGGSSCIALLVPLAEVRRDMDGMLVEAVEAATDRLALSESDRVELVLREGKDGVRYLLALNPDVDQPRQDVVSVQGNYASAEDIDIPGAFPVALDHRSGRTAFRLRLAPCEMAAICLRPAAAP